MNETPVSTRPSLNRERLRAQLKTFNLSRGQGMFGLTEVIGLAGSLLVLALVIVAYLYFLMPARSRLNALQLERTRLQTQLRTSQDAVQHGQTTEATVQSITQSLDNFENDQLMTTNRGRMGLYDSLNGLIRKNGLRNTSGPTYAPLEPKGTKTATSGDRSANSKWQSVYPGIVISLTVEGPYQNLRRFIRELEQDKQFVIINSVELERSTETNSSPSPDGNPTTGARSSLVSLRLDMASYFQRGTSQNEAPESTSN
jgi:Tfp pilus assembly protein PilO